MTDDREDDLEWLAFRYVAAELTTDERTAFEARLANDRAACEAVGRQVELACAIRAQAWAAAPPPVARRSRPWRWSPRGGQLGTATADGGRRASAAGRRIVRGVAILATGLATAILFWRPFVVDPGRALDPHTRAGELAVVWNNVRTELSTQPAWRDEQLDAELPSSARPTSSALDDDVHAAAPDWMLAALVAGKAQSEKQRPAPLQD